MRYIPYQLMDEETKMVVGNMDVGVQLLLGNTYILYKVTHLLMWKKDKKSIMSHYDFPHQIALAWLLGTNGSTTNNQPVKK